MLRNRILILVLLSALSGCNRVAGSDENGRTPLMRAAQSGDLRAVQKLARRGTINDQVVGHSSLRQLIAFLSWMQELPERRAGWTALMFAVDSGRVGIVQELLRRGADPNLGAGPYRPVLLAIRHGRNPAILEALLRAGGSPEIAQPVPLQQAVRLQDTAMVRLLLQARATVDRGQHETPLISAVRTGNLPVVQQLLRAGAAVDAKETQQGWSALGFALSAQREDIAAVLLEAGADRQPLLDNALLGAVESGSAAEVKRLLAAGANPNATDGKRRLALAIALNSRREDLAFTLLDAGAIVPGQTRQAMLYTAAVAGADSLIKVLLGDSLKPAHSHLGAAAAAGHLSTVRLLLAAGAPAQGQTGEPLRDAIRGGHPEIIRAILAGGADVNYELRGESPLAYAVRGRATAVTRVLLETGADAARPQSMPLIYTPIVHGDTLTAALLLDHGAGINAVDTRGLTTLDHAIRLEKPASIIRFLERRGGHATLQQR